MYKKIFIKYITIDKTMKIINKFSVTYGGKEVFGSDWHPAVSANPYVSFFVKASASGPMKFQWTEDGGAVTEKTVNIKVT